MTDTDEQNKQNERPLVLGRMPEDEADRTLEPPPLRVPRRRKVAEAARMPRGAWVRLRVSGGIMFRTSELVVFEDGRLSYRSSATSVYGQTLMVRQLTEAQVNEVRALLGATDIAALSDMDNGRGRDTMTYELSVRDGRKTHTVVASQGTVPDNLTQIINMLGELVRIGADEIQV